MIQKKSLSAFIYFCLATISAWAFLASTAQAAKIFPEIKSYQENGDNFFEIIFFLNSEDEDINVLTGEIGFSETGLKFETIRNGDSIVNMWIENPDRFAEGKISFSGGISNGYLGDKGPLFSVIFSPKQSTTEQSEIVIGDIEAYINDGKGTKKILPENRYMLNLAKAEQTINSKDRKSPEVFAAYVTRDPNLEGGKWVAIFNALDKGGGIDYYEVFESLERYDKEKMADDESIKWKKWQNITAYVLDDQYLESYIYVKAVDRAGNVRIAEVIPAKNQEFAKFNYNILIFSILSIILGVIIFYIFIIFKTRKDGG